FKHALEADAEGILTFLEKGRALQQRERFQLLITVCSALWPDQAEAICTRYAAVLQTISEISAQALQAEGLSGPALGQALRERRLQAVAQVLAG
ncbi:MAG: hypothetical protein MI754_08305, partial [Chromatiales bacterium]|nr:hypothetical protein [Chromatiales bacterium]